MYYNMNNLLPLIGKALYGEQWVSSIANDLHVNRKTIQRYANNEVAVNPKLYPEILDLLHKKHGQVEFLAEKVKNRIELLTDIVISDHTYKINIKKADLQKLIESKKRGFMDKSSFTYLAKAISPNGISGVQDVEIKLVSYKDGDAVLAVTRPFINSEFVKKTINIKIHKSRIYDQSNSVIVTDRSAAKAIYNAVFSGLSCYIDKDVRRPVNMLNGRVVDHLGSVLSKEDFFNIWYYSPNNGTKIWQKAEDLGMYSDKRIMLEVEE